MRKRALTVLMLAMLVPGCTTWRLRETWTKSAATIQESTRDDWECRRSVTDIRSAPKISIVGGGLSGIQAVLDQEAADRAYARCMRSRGYARAR